LQKSIKDLGQVKQDLNQVQDEYAKLSMKLLYFRKDDIMDLLIALKPDNAEDKSKLVALSKEMMSIEDEIFELEKKYGELPEKHDEEDEKEEPIY